MESRSHQQFYGSSSHPALTVLLSRPEANDSDQSLYFQVELSPNSSGHVAFVFDTSDAEVTAQPELDWETLVFSKYMNVSLRMAQVSMLYCKHRSERVHPGHDWH